MAVEREQQVYGKMCPRQGRKLENGRKLMYTSITSHWIII